jgi:hypothetical protein
MKRHLCEELQNTPTLKEVATMLLLKLRLKYMEIPIVNISLL